MNGDVDVALLLKLHNLTIQTGQCLVNNRWRSARAKGYNVERDCTNYYREKGFFAIRINSRAQKGIFRSVDVVAYDREVKRFLIIQCKYKKKYLGAEEIGRIKLAATQWGGIPILCYRDRGLKFEEIP